MLRFICIIGENLLYCLLTSFNSNLRFNVVPHPIYRIYIIILDFDSCSVGNQLSLFTDRIVTCIVTGLEIAYVIGRFFSNIQAYFLRN